MIGLLLFLLLIACSAGCVYAVRLLGSESPFRYGSRVFVTRGEYREMTGRIRGSKIGREWPIILDEDSCFAWIAESKLQLLDASDTSRICRGARVLITHGDYRGREGEVCISKISDEWNVKIDIPEGTPTYKHAFIPECHLRIIESPIPSNQTMGVTTQQAANALTAAFTPAWYSIWMDTGIVSERYGTSSYQTEAMALQVCQALQEAYTRLLYDCTFTPQLRAGPEEDPFALDMRLLGK